MKTEITIGFFGLVIWSFFLLWQQSGWYRIDCALGQEKACALIAEEYVKKSHP